MRSFLTFLLGLGFTAGLHAQVYTAELVHNLNPGSGSNPRWITVWDTTLYFFASDGGNGHKIFSMTPSTLPVLCPNVSGAAVFGDGSVSWNYTMPQLNNALYIPVSGPGVGRELFRYDGNAVPVLVQDINPGNGGSSPAFPLVYNNKLYFQAGSPALGTELWVHDPQANTTTCLTDINPGSNPSTIAFITPYNNKLYFAGTNGNDTTNGNTGLELYMHDPALNTTSLVADIYPGYMPGNPTAFMVANGKLYFVATDPVYGKELYEYDGTNVTRLTDINPGPAQGVYTSDHSFPTWYNGKIYLAANDANNLINIAAYDPVTGLVNIFYTGGPGFGSNPRYFKAWDNKLFFTALDTAKGFEIWTCDGVNPPVLQYDVWPGSGSSLPKFYTPYGADLYFNASNDTSSAEELFRLKNKGEEPIGIQESGREGNFVAYPNPARQFVQVDGPAGQYVVEGFDLCGKMMFRQQVSFPARLEFPAGYAGYALLLIRDGEGKVLDRKKLCIGN